jgi:nucleoside-diphosphate-sugar epimerase
MKTLDESLYINDTINIGDDNIVSIKDLAETIIRLTGSNSKIIYLPPLKEGDMTRRQPDNKKMLSVLNRPLLTLEQGLIKILSGL